MTAVTAFLAQEVHSGSSAFKARRIRAHSMADSSICIIEDDEAVRTALCALITAHGWRARPFHSASAFLDAGVLTQETCACLLIDLELDGMNGVEFRQHLLEQGHPVPAIILTARPDSPIARRTQAEGKTTVLGKPFEADDLIRAIEDTMAWA